MSTERFDRINDHACKQWLRSHSESAADLIVLAGVLIYAIVAMLL